jgi:ricin-type beta-trefoil lectin protein
MDVILRNGATAARAANPSLIIGGDGELYGTFADLDVLLADTTLKSAGVFQFASFHSYTADEANDNITTLQSTIVGDGYPSTFPIFMTEWNYSYSGSFTEPHIAGIERATYVGDQLVFFLRQPGLTGTALFTLLPNNVATSPYEDCNNCILNTGLYSVDGSNTYTLAPQLGTYRLASVDLGLGTGTSKAYSTTLSGAPSGNGDFAQGWTAPSGNPAAMLVNDSATATTATFTFTNSSASGCGYTVDAYVADTGTNTAVSPTQTFTNQCFTAGTLMVSGVAVPAYSVAGIIAYNGATGIQNGTYIITSVHGGLAIDDPDYLKTDGTDMQIYTVNDGANQQWTVTNLGNNVITLTNGASSQLLDVAEDSKLSGALVDQWPANGHTNQQWNVISLGGGYFELTSVNSGLALDVVGGGTTNGTKIDQSAYGGKAWQQWIFTTAP